MQFLSDKVRLNGPKSDGSMTVTFEVGEYQQPELRALIGMPQDVNLKVTVEVIGE